MHAKDDARAQRAEHGGTVPRRRPTTESGGQLRNLMPLQATAGNAAVVQMLRRSGHPWAGEQQQHSAGESRTVTRNPSSDGVVIQRCYYCNVNTCVDGAQCGRKKDHQGLFSSGINPSNVVPYNQAKAVRTNGAYENEHMIPGTAYRTANMGNLYTTAPTFRVDIDTHRGAVRGGVAGNGITSTGSGTVNQQWSRSVGDQLRSGNHAEAVRMTATDDYNASMMQNSLTEERVREISNTVYAHHTQGLITAQEAGDIVNMLVDRWYKRQH
ncbi:hypothetical protein [Streptomyces sp. NPDC057509]|uniref:hypothetical protein n=1 Tax=Streptomyces sp. NPDC057509 TaxID=3346152 RepID=UPI003690A64E